jgi:5-methylcytosine-specific restriction endonuclease McrA
MRSGAGYKTLSYYSVAERDRWTCQLCGAPVDRTLGHPHPYSASLDHIVPLSFGGQHSEDNAQLAHFLCNSRKGNGSSAVRAGGQLTLV